MVSNDVVVRIPHSLGAAEARRRIEKGVISAQVEFATFLRLADADWNANRLSFRVSALAQTVRGVIDVQESYVELTAQLPFLIRLLAKRFVPAIRDNGQRLLK